MKIEKVVPPGTEPALVRMRMARREAGVQDEDPSFERGFVYLVEGLRQCAMSDGAVSDQLLDIADRLAVVVDQVDNLGRVDREVVKDWLATFKKSLR